MSGIQAPDTNLPLFSSARVAYPDHQKFRALASVLYINFLARRLQQSQPIQAGPRGADIVGVGGLDKGLPEVSTPDTVTLRAAGVLGWRRFPIVYAPLDLPQE